MRKLKKTKETPGSHSKRVQMTAKNINELPVELKHEVLKNLTTGYLEDVCAKVSPHWNDMVVDIVNQRASKVNETIPGYVRTELKSHLLPAQHDDPVTLLRLFERAGLQKKFQMKSDLVSADVLNPGKGIIHKIWKIRQCDCSALDECIIRTVHLMPVLQLFIVQASSGLNFFHMQELEQSLDNNSITEAVKEYQCESEGSWFDTTARGRGSSISVYRDEIVLEETARALLLFKVACCDHSKRVVKLQRLRRIFLPIWSCSLCLLESQIFILYSTGYVGKWDKDSDELSISPNICNAQSDPQIVHSSRMLKLGKLVFIVTKTITCHWNAIDTSSESMNVHTVRLPELITSAFLQEEPPWECTEVYYMELWVNCFIAHCEVQSLVTGEAQDRLMIARTKRYPELTDFHSIVPFKESFLTASVDPIRTLTVNGIILSPFLPLLLEPWELEPIVVDPSPVAYITIVEWPSGSRRKSRKLKVHRVVLCNSPKSKLR